MKMSFKGQAAKIMTTQIRTTLDFRAVCISRATNLKNNEINENMHELAKQGVQENSYMKRMTYQSTRDTRFMTIIALTTAIFLPATLVAVSLAKTCLQNISPELQTNVSHYPADSFRNEFLRIRKRRWNRKAPDRL